MNYNKIGGRFSSLQSYARYLCQVQTADEWRDDSFSNKDGLALVYKSTGLHDLRAMRHILKCLRVHSSSSTLESLQVQKDIKNMLQARAYYYLDKTEKDMLKTHKSSRAHTQLSAIRKELKEIYYFLSTSYTAPVRYLPFRGRNTQAGRGAQVRETRDNLQRRIEYKYNNMDIFKYFIFEFMEVQMIKLTVVDDYLGWDVKIKDSFFTYNTSNALLFDVHEPGHVFRGILLPEIGLFPRRLVYIDTSKQRYVDALLSTRETIQNRFGFKTLQITLLPNMISDEGILDLQRSEAEGADSCRKDGQCQHWSFMTAYVFLKEYDKLITENKTSIQEYREMCIRVWRILEQADSTPAFNALQREVGILG